MTIIKLLILNSNRAELLDAFFYAQRHFWHSNYNSAEQPIFSISVKYCTRFMYFAFAAQPATLSGYVITPLIENLGQNKSNRALPFKMWVDWPISDTSYYELMFTFQVICLYLIGVAYVCPEMFLCLFNLHVMGQFRILQYRMLNFWNVKGKEIDEVMYADYCYAALKKCIRYHQLFIEFCDKIEQIYTMSIFTHMVFLSLLMGLDCYEILVADATPSMRLMFIFHVAGSLIHLCVLTYTCHLMMEESTNINTTVYLGSWSTLPMNKAGISLRSDLKFVMIRSEKPCCLTAGGFFPVSLETFTTLLSSTFSYFTLMREAFMRHDDD
nr:odorant receptor 49b-like [Osmia lignaria]